MDKALAFLEKYVEWIAIGIGGLVFMLAIWFYWIAPGVSVTVGNDEYSPGSVDEAVMNGPGKSLESMINNPRPGDVPPPPDFTAEFLADLGLNRYQPAPVKLAYSPAPLPFEVPTDTMGPFRVDQAPTPPPAQIVRLASGRSFADVQDGGGQVAAVDLAEVRVDFTIPPEAIADAFRRVSLPAGQQNTSVLRVTMMRQRKLPDGSWGEDKEVPLLANNPLASEFPLPDETAPVETKQAYAQFAEQNPQWVLQPPFYEVRAGDNPNDLEVVIDVPGPGAQPAAGQEEGDATTQDAQDGENQTNFNFQDQDAQEQGDGRGGDAGINQAPPVQQPPTRRPQQQPQEGEEQAAQAPPPLPPGGFNAAMLQAPISGWAWDIDAVPGETYRYRVMYALKNPMFGTTGVAARKELETLLVLPSQAPEGWSPPITVEPLTYFYMTESGSRPTFTVFRWQNGRWQAERFPVSPGDAIGSANGEGIDFGTGQTLVDVREDPTSRENFALLVDEQGRFSRRRLKEDSADPKLKELQDLINAPADDGVARRE